MFCERYTDVESLYTVGRKLGVGNFAKVVQASCNFAMPQHGLKVGAQVAIKIVKKPPRVSTDKVDMLHAEIDVLRTIEHPNLVRLYDVHETAAKLYLVMELCTGGELFDKIVTLGKYTEEDARYFTFKLLNAVLYLHDKHIVHRDLKPENILLSSPRPDAELKITDFGLSRITGNATTTDRKEQMLHTRCGTPGYAAPEVLGGRNYGPACDMWAVGTIVHILLCAYPPSTARRTPK
ncbi:kinase-like domain-containing protein [Pavlovales sp. CCMP2436]|nr:kinase-like domain-containing protein [Pavlovales sp. CCMP2436]